MMKKTVILLSILFIFQAGVFAQSEVPNTYTSPEFPGGFKEFRKYAGTYINYPHPELEKRISGQVKTTLFINKEGKVKFVNTTGNNISFNNETKRVLKLSDKWVPGKRNGIAIDTMINFNVYFSSDKENPNATENDIEILIYFETIQITDMDIKKAEEEEYEKDLLVKRAIKLNEEGSELLKSKQFDEAIEKFNEAIKLGGNRNAFLYNRGLAYLNLKDDEKAKADFLEASRSGDVDAAKIYNDLFK